MLTSIHDRLFRRQARLLLQGAPAVYLLASTMCQSTQRLRALRTTEASSIRRDGKSGCSIMTWHLEHTQPELGVC